MNTRDPQFLYRYRHLQGEHHEWTKRILTDSVLYFASPQTFNDPFDCKVNFRPSFSVCKLKEKYIEILKDLKPHLSLSERKIIAIRDVNAHKDNFITPMTRDLQNKIDNIGVLSLSATARNVLLWSHYADGHKGLCLKFIVTSDTPFFCPAQPVKYATTYPKVDICDPIERQVDAFLLTKAIDWKYEEEWRIIDHDPGKGNKSFPEELLVEVIFGAQMEPQNKKAVADWIRGRKKKVELSQASIVPGTFSIKITP